MIILKWLIGFVDLSNKNRNPFKGFLFFYFLLGNSISRNKQKKYTLGKRVYERNKK